PRRSRISPMNDTVHALLRLAAVALVAVAASAVAAEKPFTVYVGTYTDGTSRGIYRFTFDPATGSATEPVLAAEAQNPSFLALSPSGRFLYAVGEIGSFQGAKTGVVSAFAVDPGTGDLKLLNQQPSEGTGPTHLVVDGGGKNVLVANYGGGNVVVLPIAPDGTLKPVSSNQVHEGSGPDKGRQEKPHAHGIYLDPAERFALAPDLGADRVFVYRFDAAKGTLEPHGAGAPEPGSGPRHLAFHPNGKYVYVINELLSTMAAFSYDGEKGALTSLQTISCLPAGFSGTSWTAEVAVSPDGRFVYGSNRGDDSLAIFAVEPSTGRLTVKGHSPIGGKYPRHFTIDPTGRFILAGHQNSGTIGVLRLDPATGMPSLVGSPVKVDKPVCLLPVPQR
ncbi:MAG TPA: lactonase family protein, partial [Vicinamibacteria bacterium]|nr:lactonase family protein [Vicinamibacteria bacterium]